MRDLILNETRASVGDAARPRGVEVSRFKDEATDVPRVVATSQSFIVYSVKNRAVLRVLPRAKGSQANKLAYSKHTDNVTSATFVGARSNIVASTSKNELLVWYVDSDNEIYTYFTAPINVTSLVWVPIANKPPECMAIVNKGATSDAVLVGSSDLIIKSTETPEGTVGKPDGSMVASNITTLRTVSGDRAITAAASPIIAFSANNESVVTCTLGNANTPAWKPCDGDAVFDFTLLPNAVFVASAAKGFYVWDVSAEPKPLQHIVCSPLPNAPVYSTSAHVLAFLATGDAAKCEAGVFGVKQGVGMTTVAFYGLNSHVARVSSCVLPGPNDEPQMLHDQGSVLQFSNFQDAPTNAVGQPAAAAAASPTRGAAKVPAPRSVASPASQATPAVGGAPPPYNSPHVGPAPIPNPGAMPAIRVGPAPPVRNVALAGLGLPALQGGQATAGQLADLKTHIDQAIANTATMLDLARDMVSKDHDALVEEALKAQANTLAAMAPASADTGLGGSTLPFDSVIDGITEPVAKALVEGINAAVENELRTQLESALRNVLTRHAKKTQKDSVGELRNNLETIVADVMDTVQTSVLQKQSAYGSRLLHYVTDVASEGSKAVGQMQLVITQLQNDLNAVVSSGVLEEVQQLREEVVALKRRVGAEAAAVQTAEVPPETVLATAKGLIHQGDTAGGLRWVLSYNSAEMLSELLTSCDEQTRDAMLEDTGVTDEMWSKVVGLLTSAPKAEGLLSTLGWLCDILGDRPGLTKNDQLVVHVQAFMDAWKHSPQLSGAARDKLRELFIMTRR